MRPWLKNLKTICKEIFSKGFSRLPRLIVQETSLNTQRKRQCCSRWREKSIWQTHIKKTVIRLFVTVWKRAFLSGHAHIFAWEYEWARLHHGCVFARMCAATPACHLCVCVDNVVIDYRRPVVRVAVVTRRLRWLHWVKSSSSGCLWWPWGVRMDLHCVLQLWGLHWVSTCFFMSVDGTACLSRSVLLAVFVQGKISQIHLDIQQELCVILEKCTLLPEAHHFKNNLNI